MQNNDETTTTRTKTNIHLRSFRKNLITHFGLRMDIRASAVDIPIIFANTGQSWRFTAPCHAGVEALRHNVYEVTSVQLHDQIMLVGGPPFTRVNPKKVLEALEGLTVFVFDRKSIPRAGEAVSAPLIPLSPSELRLSTALREEERRFRDLGTDASPLLRALATYELQFLLHARQGKEYIDGAHRRIQSVQASLEQQECQLEAIGAALGNLEIIATDLQRKFTEFQTDFKGYQETQNPILGSFNADLEALKDVSLHPALQTDSRSTLYDCCPVEGLLPWAEERRRGQRKLIVKVEEFAQSITRTDAEVKEQKAKIKKDELVKQMDEIREALERQKALVVECEEKVNTMDADRKKVSMVLDEAVGIAEATHVADSAHTTHIQNYLPAIKAADSDMRALQDTAAECKQRMSEQLLGILQRVSLLQSQMRERGQVFAVLKQAVKQERVNMEELKHVKLMPKAYVACLGEIVRRRMYSRMFHEKVQRMAEEVSELREGEVERRETFLRQHGIHLPADLVSLNGRPPHCEISIRSFDENLPPIDTLAASIPISTSTLPSALPSSLDHLRSGRKKAEEGSREEASDEVGKLREKLASQEEELKRLQAQISEEKYLSKVRLKKFKDLVASLALLHDVPYSPEEDKDVAEAGFGVLSQVEVKVASWKPIVEGGRELIAGVVELNRDTASLVEAAVGPDAAAAVPIPIPPTGSAVMFTEANKLVQRIKMQLHDLQDCISPPSNLKSEEGGRISYTRLEAGDIALFMMKRLSTGHEALPIFKAFHSNLPNRYLHLDSAAPNVRADKVCPFYIIARITLVERMVAAAGNSYGAVPGEEMFTLYIENPPIMAKYPEK